MDTSSMLEPLQYFETVGRDKHHQNAVSFFDQLLQTSGVNVFENKDTVEAYRKQTVKNACGSDYLLHA